MAVLLLAAVFGSDAHWIDPNAARSTIVSVFLVMQYQRRAMRALRTSHVIWSSAVGGLFGAVLGQALWRFPLAEWPAAVAGAAVSTLLCVAVITLSFYFLTLRRGTMP